MEPLNWSSTSSLPYGRSSINSATTASIEKPQQQLYATQEMPYPVTNYVEEHYQRHSPQQQFRIGLDSYSQHCEGIDGFYRNTPRSERIGRSGTLECYEVGSSHRDGHWNKECKHDLNVRVSYQDSHHYSYGPKDKDYDKSEEDVYLENKSNRSESLKTSFTRQQEANVQKNSSRKRLSEDLEEASIFPGPLTLNHTKKEDVLQYIEEKSKYCSRDQKLIWNYLELMIRLDGNVNENDVATLLISSSLGNFDLFDDPDEASATYNGVKKTEEYLETDLSDPIMSPVVAKIRKLYFYKKYKKACQLALKYRLWEYAFLLAGKDSSVKKEVINHYSRSQPLNDPLRTVCDTICDEIPVASKRINVDEWEDWRLHLGLILGNSFNSPAQHLKSIITLGDTLLKQGLVEAAHFCYIMASLRPENYSNKSSKFVLLGADHSKPFQEFTTIEAIQMTEVFEYALSLAKNSPVCFPSLQPFKFYKGCRLVDCGCLKKAFEYFKDAADNLVASPASHSAYFVNNLSSKIEFYLLGFGIESGEAREPKWLKR